MHKILLVEDDSLLRESLAEQLEASKAYQVVQAANADFARRAVKEGFFDAIILDIGLPDADGRDLCREWREEKRSLPILMLTSHTTDMDVVSGFDAGVTDYILKPFRIGVLLARLQAHLRRHEMQEDAEYEIGNYRFQPNTRRLLDRESGKRILLTEKERDILKYLHRAGERIVGREELLREVWGYNANVTTHTLETHIYRLRKKIEPKPESLRILITDAGGYRLAKEGIQTAS